MALASASHGAGGGSRIADFWRISAVFDPIRGGPEPRTADQIQLAGKLYKFLPATEPRATGR